MEDEMISDYTKCWCCGSLVLKARIEKHHTMGKEFQDTVKLCILCHDFVDRMALDDIEVFCEFFSNVVKEMDNLKEDGSMKYIKLMMLKFGKLARLYIQSAPKQPEEQQIHLGNSIMQGA